MGYLFHILLAVAALWAGEVGLGRELAAAEVGAGVFVLPYLASWFAHRSGERGHFRSAALWTRMAGLAPVLAYALFLLGTDWLRLVREWTGAELDPGSWPELALALVFAPYVLAQLLGIHAEARLQDSRAGVRRRVFVFQARMFAAALLPLLLYTLTSVAVGWVPGWPEHIEQVALYYTLFVALLLGAMALLLPALLMSTWETAPLPEGPQRALLDAVARRADFRPRDVRVWKTGDLMANAVILGFGDRRRTVLFSDSLLSMLGPGELAAVYAHEIGHAKRRHVGVFLAWALALFLLADLAADRIAGEDPWSRATYGLGTLGLWWIGFGWLSRRCELEADLFGVELLGDPGAMASALERVGGRLRDVAGWRHFSTSSRVRFLWRAWREPDFARRFQARLRAIALLGVAAALVALAWQAATLAASYRQDLVHAELALGRWDRALARARAVPDFEAEDLELLARGAERQGERERLDADALAAELERELASGAPAARASETATLLAALRPALLPVAEALSARAEGRADEAARALADCPEPWRARLHPARSGARDGPR